MIPIHSDLTLLHRELTLWAEKGSNCLKNCYFTQKKTLVAIYSKWHFCTFKIYLLLHFSFNPLEIWNTSSWSYDLQINGPVFLII